MALAPQAQLSVLLVNPGFSELTHLASHLADQGTLRRYVTTFRTTGEWQERISDRLPAAGRLLRRRRLPPGVPPEIVSIKGAAADITHALAIRMPPWSGPLARPLAEFALHHARFALGKGAAKLVQPGDVVIASYGCALEGFRVATDRSAVRVLNYPIAHHRYSRRLLEEEARRQPEFASSLQDHKLPFGWEERLDLECGLADRILVGSTFVKNTFVAEGIPEDKLVVAPYGVDIVGFAPGQREGPGTFNVLFVGQIGQRKGISYLLDAYETFSKPDSRLTLLGDFVGSTEWVKRRKHLFRQVSRVPKWEVPQVMASASVLVLPSLIEGMSLVILEAMSSGIPVIVSENTGGTEAVRDGIDGFVVPIRDARAIAEKLELLYRDASLAESMGANARSRAEEFSWSRYTSQMDAVLAEDLAGVGSQ